MTERNKQFSISLLTIVSLIVSFIYLLAASWLRWGELIVDTGRELWLPTQLLHGKILYRDFFCAYGPFPPYLLAGLYTLFGVHVNVAVGCGIVITSGVAFMLYKIARLFLDTLIAGLVVMTFLFVFAFGYYYDWSGIFNFILPYSLASTCFMLFGAVALYGFLKFLLTQQKRFLALWNLALVFAFFSRIELGLAIWAGFVVVGGVAFAALRPVPLWKWVTSLVAPALLAALGYGGLLLAIDGWDGFYVSIIQHILTLKDNPYTLRAFGSNDLPLNSWLMLRSFGVHVVIIGLIGAGGASIDRFFRRTEQTPFFLMLGTCVLGAAVWFSLTQMNLSLHYRSLPIFLLIGSISCLIKIIRRQEVHRHLAMLTVFVIGLVMLIRILFNATCFGYGFFMLNIGLIGYYLGFFHLVKEVSARYHRYLSWEFFAFLLLGYFVWQNLLYWQGSFAMYTQKNLPITSPRGTLFGWEDARTARFIEAIHYIENFTPPQATVVVFPEGEGLNFFTRRENPTGYHSFTPQMCAMIGERQILNRLHETPIDYVVLTHRETLEFGPVAFGRDYARDIYAWLLENYRLVKVIGPYPFSSQEFGIAIFQKK